MPGSREYTGIGIYIDTSNSWSGTTRSPLSASAMLLDYTGYDFPSDLNTAQWLVKFRDSLQHCHPDNRNKFYSEWMWHCHSRTCSQHGLCQFPSHERHAPSLLLMPSACIVNPALVCNGRGKTENNYVHTNQYIFFMASMVYSILQLLTRWKCSFLLKGKPANPIHGKGECHTINGNYCKPQYCSVPKIMQVLHLRVVPWKNKSATKQDVCL